MGEGSTAVSTAACVLGHGQLRERLKLLITGKLWLRQKNFGQPLQPQLPTVDTPFTRP